MNKNIFTALLLFFSFGNAFPSLSQQAVPLPGVVVAQNSRIRTGATKYLEGALVFAAGARPAHSDSNGKFTLVFDNKPAGELLRIQVKKNGYVVVNDPELEQAALFQGQKPLKVVLCSQQVFLQNQQAYYRIAESMALRQMQDQLTRIQQDADTRSQIVAELEAQLKRKIAGEKQLMAVLEEVQKVQQMRGEALAGQLLMVNLDDAGITFLRAHKAFRKGNLNLALAILDSVDLATALNAVDQALAQDRKEGQALAEHFEKQEQQQQLLQEVLLKARLLSLKARFNEAEQQYLLALSHQPQSVDIRWELAQFYTHLNRFSRALEQCDAALAKTATGRQRAKLLSLKGRILVNQNKDPEAKATLEEALALHLQLIKSDSVLYLPHLALLLENLADIHYKEGNLEKARIHYEQAILIWRDLVAQLPARAYAKAASALGGLALVYRGYNQPAQADTLFRQSLFLLRQLAAEHPGRYDADLANTLENLGLLYSDWTDAATADAWLRESGSIWQTLSEANPLTYQPRLASNLLNRGRLYVMNKHWALADSCLNSALELYHFQESSQPEDYLPLIASTLNLKGVVYDKTGKPQTAMKLYAEATGILEQLAAQNPQTYEPELWSTYLNVMALLKNRMLATGDTTLRSEGIKVWQQLNARMDAHPGIAEGEGELLRKLREDVHYFEGFFANADRKFLTREAALAAANYFENQAGQSAIPADRLALQQLAVDTLRTAFGKIKEDTTLALRLGQALGGLATYAAFSGEFEKAEGVVREALLLAPGESWLYIPLATALVFQGRFEEAKSIYRNFAAKPYFNNTTFRSIFLRDLAQMQQAGFSHPDLEKAIEYLSGQ